MIKINAVFITCCWLFLFHSLWAQNSWKGYEQLNTPAQNYVVYQTGSPVLIDGKADEADWNKAEWTADFVDIEGDKKPKPLFRTRMKMLWDDTNLYLLAELEDPNIWAYYGTHDQIVYHENDIEVFIDPDGNTHDYYEFEVNARNTLFDLFMPKPYRNDGKALVTWNSEGFKSAVSIDGTLNDPTDTDRKWTVEMKIPFADLRSGERTQIPEDKQIWKINFSRVEWRTEVVDGKYQKMKDPANGKDYPEYNWVWSPPGLINMHYPERWGNLQFSKTLIGRETVAFESPEDEILKNNLWLVYYKQQEFRKKYNRFAANLNELKLNNQVQDKSGNTGTMTLLSGNSQFTIQLEDKNGMILSLNETGLFRKNQK